MCAPHGRARGPCHHCATEPPRGTGKPPFDYTAPVSRGLIGKIFGGASGRGASQPVVGLAGKHPAWPDHIRGHGYLGRPDPALESAASAFYRAIEKVIDSGAWGSPRAGAAAGVIPYGHEVLWLLGGRSGKGRGEKVLIAGRLWPGRDQAGREQYPMIGWAILPGWGVLDAVRAALPALERLERRVIAAKEREGVESAVAETQRELLGETPTGKDLDESVVLKALGTGAWDDTRLLSRMGRDAEFLSAQSRARGENGGAATVLRVGMSPPGRESLTVLLSSMAPIMPGDVLVAMPYGAGYADVIAHTPGALRANELVQLRRDETVILPVQRETGEISPEDESRAASVLARMR